MVSDSELGIRVLVCGGQRFDWRLLHNALSDLHANARIKLIIHNGGPVGAPRMADMWAKQRGIPIKVIRANRRLFPFFAIQFRNQALIEDGQPNLVVHLPGGIGTPDLMRRARAAGIKTWKLR